MSLINQMLKDLERRSKPTLNPAGTMSGLQASAMPSFRNGRNVLLPLILGIVFIFALIVFVFKVNSLVPKKTHVTATVSAKSPVFVSQPTALQVQNTSLPNLHASASTVTGLTLQVQKDRTLLRVLLTQDTLYRVSKNAKQQYVIVLNHAQLMTNLPSINTSNSAIQDIRMLNEGKGDLYIVLTPRNGAELNRLELNSDGKYPELQVDFIYNEKVYTESISSQQPAAIIPELEGRLTKSVITMGPEEEYQQALQYSAEGNRKRATAILTSLTAKFPEYTLARESLIKLLLDQGKQIEAKSILQLGLQQHPYYPPYAELKARILVNEGQVDEAIKFLQSSAPAIKNDPEYHAFIAALYQRQGQSLLAAKLYEQLLPLQPDNAVWWMGLGIAYEDLGKHNEAMQAYARADNGDKLNPELKAYVESRMHNLQ